MPTNQPLPTGEASDAPSQPAASAAPTGTPLAPARITIPALSSAVYLPGDRESVQLAGLSDRLVPGGSVSLVFETSTGGQPLVLSAPMGIPLSPASRGPGIEPNENLGGGEGGHEN